MTVHDYGNVIHSFMYYSGSTFTIGRNMGWGNANVSIPANLNVGGINTDYISSRGTNGPLIIDPNFSTNNFVRIYDQLQIEGSLYVNGTIQGMNVTYWANNVFHSSNEGETRIYFASSSTTYIRGAGTQYATSIVFMSPTQFDMGYFNNNVFYKFNLLHVITGTNKK